MSLKALHIVFVAASIMLCLGFGVWSLKTYDATRETSNLIMGCLSLLSAAGLVWYGCVVLRKLKHISYL